MIESITVSTSGQGLYEVTPEVRRITEVDGRVEGLCTLFLPRTSASLTIQENADPSARHDLERWLNRHAVFISLIVAIFRRLNSVSSVVASNTGVRIMSDVIPK